MSGHPSGPPEWPEPGGMMNQDAKLVEFVSLLRSEWPYITSAMRSAGNNTEAELRRPQAAQKG